MPKKRSAIKILKGVTKGKKAKRPFAPAQSTAVESTQSVLDGPMKPLIYKGVTKRGWREASSTQ